MLKMIDSQRAIAFFLMLILITTVAFVKKNKRKRTELID